MTLKFIDMKTKHIILLAAAALVTLSSCNKLLDIPQRGVLNFDTFYQTDEDAESAIASCYLKMRDLEFNYLLGKNMLTDDFWAGGGGRNDNGDLEQLNEFTFGTDQSFLQGMFTSYYQIIYQANVVISHVKGDSEVMRRAVAEARVFRAWAYFELITMWGNPPLVDHELDPSEYASPNGSTEALWGLVEEDLDLAIKSGMLTEKAGADDKTWRVTKQFAQAVLGKAYLWQKKYDEAADILDEVIDSKLYRLFDDYENIISFRAKQNCESLFESVRVDNPNNGYENFYTIFAVMAHYRTEKMNLNDADGLAGTGWGFLNPTKDLYNDFVRSEGEDGYRLNCTLKTYAQMQERGHSVKQGETIINEGYFMWKWRVLAEQYGQYAGGMGFFCNINNPRWMRYGEVLLLASEANLMAGRQDKADKYYNEIRRRARASEKSGVTLDDIKLEKRVELCGESTRFQDLLRWGDAEAKMKNNGEHCPVMDSNGQVTYIKYNGDNPAKYGFKEKHNRLPYPGVEIRLNKNIQQNPGW